MSRVLPGSWPHSRRLLASRPAKRPAPPAPALRARCARPRPRCICPASHRRLRELWRCASRTPLERSLLAGRISLDTYQIPNLYRLIVAGGEFHPLAQDVAEEDMAFLDASCVARGDPQADVGVTRQVAATFTG